ncbi:hypothetical protein JCM17380_52650 [Desulfosporosinus burensis]
MDIPYFTRLWSEGKTAEVSGKSFWDNRAAEFNKLVSQGGPDERIKKIVEFLSHNCLLNKNSSVLDIACGPGRFAVEFAKQSTDVTGLDISNKMLDYATLFETENNSSDEKNDLIRRYLEEISVNGFVMEKVQTKTAWIYWEV